MAENNAIYSADKVQELLKCPVCLDRFNDPKILPCQHTFCKSPCLDGLIDRYAHSIKCPECRIEHRVPFNGAEGFPSNRTIKNFLDLPTHTPRPSEESDTTGVKNVPDTGTEKKCGICEKDVETSKCVHCDKLVCPSCKASHLHQMKFDIGRLVNQIRRGIPKISNSISSAEQRSEQLRQQEESIKSEVTDHIERYIKELRDRQKMLHSELDTFLQGELRNIRIHQENLEVELASISSYCDSTEGLLNRAECEIPDADLVKIKKQCVEYMEQLRKSESEGLPESKQAKFVFDGQSLRGSISGFGNIVINSPSDHTSRNETQSTRSNAVIPTRMSTSAEQSQPQHSRSRTRWSRTMPLEELYSRPIENPSSQTLEGSFGRRSPPVPAVLSRAHRNSPSPRGLSLTAQSRMNNALDRGYMFNMDTDTNSVQQQMEDWRLAEEEIDRQMGSVRRNNRHMNHTAIFGAEWMSDEVLEGFMDPGSQRGRSGQTPGDNRHGRGRGDSAVSSSLPTLLQQREVDARPAIAFSVNLGGRGRRGRGARLGARRRGVANQQQRGRGTSSESRRDSNLASSRSANSAGEESSGRNGHAAESTPPAPVNRSRTFVMEEPDNNNVERPRVASPSADTGSSQRATGNHRASGSRSNAGPLMEQSNAKPVFDYKKKGRIHKIIGSEKSRADGMFHWPRGIAVSPVNDSLIVADSSNHRVQIFDCNSSFISKFGSQGTESGEFDCLTGVAVNTMGQIIIADRYNHRIQIFDRFGEFDHQFGLEGTRNGQLKYPWGVATDASGCIYVCDKENHRIQVFDFEGRYIRKFGSLGSALGEFEQPHYLTITTNGRVIVSDTNNHRLQVFDLAGNHLMAIGSQGSDMGKFQNPKGVTVDRQGFILVADSGNSRIQVFRPDGRFYSCFGDRGTGSGQFKGLEGLAISKQGYIAVSDKDNHRIQIF